MSPTPRKRRRKTGPTSDAAALDAARIYNEGVEWQQRGNTTQAEAAYRRALSIHPDFAEAHNNLGNLLKEQGKWKAAEKSYRRALQLLPDNAVLLANIGEALHRQNKMQAALEALETSLRLDPFNAAGHHHMGELLTDLKRPESAIEYFTKAHELLPNVPAVANRLGMALNALQRFDEAVTVLHATVKAHPRYFDAYPTLAEAAMKIGAVDDAIKVLEEALKLEPENTAVHAQLAEIHHARHDFLSARTAVSRAIDINPENAEHYNLSSKILNRMNLTDEAAAMARKAIALRPDAADYHHSMGIALMMSGNPGEAGRSLRRAIRLQPDHAYAHANLAELTQHLAHDADMSTMETLLHEGNLPDKQAISLHFGLGKAFEDFGDYAQAFQHFARGNALRKANSVYQYDVAKDCNTLAATFSRDYLQQQQGSGHRGVTPIFITGLPRSGKTVLETLLAHHPQVSAGGESDEFQQLALETLVRQTGKGFPDGIRELEAPAFAEIGRTYAEHLRQRLGRVDYVTNTSPGTASHIGMIRLCMPDARVILCMREACDLCTEIYKKNLAPEHHYSHDPDELGNYYLQHRELMQHWCELLPDFVHVVQFEELLQDPEKQVNALLDFCGLPREASTLDTATLPTTENSVGGWQHYREPLKPLFDILESS